MKTKRTHERQYKWDAWFSSGYVKLTPKDYTSSIPSFIAGAKRAAKNRNVKISISVSGKGVIEIRTVKQETIDD